jgi:hypothetical protein
MTCRLCGSEKLSGFESELALHFPGIKNLDKPTVLLFPKIRICLSCGNSEFSIPDRQLLALNFGTAASDSAPISSLPTR